MAQYEVKAPPGWYRAPALGRVSPAEECAAARHIIAILRDLNDKTAAKCILETLMATIDEPGCYPSE